MGAGALEAPTKKLRDYPILDVTQLKAPAKKKAHLTRRGSVEEGVSG
jgi:hypothetical protein